MSNSRYNHKHYPDPTAKKAIDNIEKEKRGILKNESGSKADDKVSNKSNSNQSFLDYFKSLRKEKDIDSMTETIWAMITMYGLDMSEVAALNYYIMERTLKTPVNQKVLTEDLKIDITQPTYHSKGIVTPTQKVLDIQRALVSDFVSKQKGGSK